MKFIVPVFFMLFIGAIASPMASEKPALGTETVALIKRGVFHLSCADALVVANLLKADGYKPVKYFVTGGESDNDFESLPTGTKNVLIEFIDTMDTIINTISAPFGDNEEIIGAIETNILGHDIENIMTAAAATYLGVATEKDFDIYIQSDFCGASIPDGFRSPLDMSEDEIAEAIEKKIRKQSK